MLRFYLAMTPISPLVLRGGRETTVSRKFFWSCIHSPEIDVLVGGKRKGKKVRNKRVKKKNKSKNDNVKMEMLVGPRTTIVMVVHGPIILHGG